MTTRRPLYHVGQVRIEPTHPDRLNEYAAGRPRMAALAAWRAGGDAPPAYRIVGQRPGEPPRRVRPEDVDWTGSKIGADDARPSETPRDDARPPGGLFHE